MRLYRCTPLRMIARPGESEGGFRVRVDLAVRERRDERLAEVRRRYTPRLASLEQRIAAADQRVAREEAQYRYQKVNTTIAFGSALLGALVERARGYGAHVMVAGIEARNEASLALHARFGFVRVGLMPEVGRKFDRWLDLVLMQRRLGTG
jgi:GNAT superfamily N-acetyltransferase